MSRATPQTADQWVDARMQVLQAMWDCLRTVKSLYPSESIPLLRGCSPALDSILEDVKVFEEKTTPLDWEYLEQWIQTANERCRQELIHDADYMAQSGVAISEIQDMNADTIQKRAKESPQARMLRRTWGPNWESALAKFQRLNPALSDPSDCIRLDVETFRRSISDRTSAIVADQKTLQEKAEGGQLARFRERWAQLTTAARRAWLRKRFPDLPSHPHSDIKACSKTEDRRLDMGIFMTPLLDIEDLSADDVLPGLLETRAALHPMLFRMIDGRSVSLGFWCGHLKPIAMEGVLSFAPDVGNEAAEPYRAVLKHGEDRNTRRSPANLNEAIPGHGLYQLEAQRRVYGSLVRCAEELPDPSGPAAATEKSPRRKDGDESLPLLTRSSRLDYYGHPEMIDLKYLDSLVKTSLAEAQDDLWQLRRDAGLWANRLGVTPATPPGRVSNLLRTVFGRIDIFHTLSRHLDTVQQHDLFRSQYYARLDSKLPEGGDALRLLTSLHGVFSSVLEEEFDLLHSFAWSPQECASDTLSRLFRMVKTNDPSIRVMGLPAVMRVIDRELQESGMQEQVPFVVMQALNDMSVVAVCLRETAKHYNLVSSFNDHAILANELEEEWEKQERPWSSVVEDTLGALGGDERHKLNVHIHDKKVDVQSRHRAFWNDVDTHMETSSPGKESSKAIVNLIRQTAPIDAVPSRLAAATSHNDWFTGNDHSPQLTLTQINRSRRRNPCLSYQSPAPGPAQIPLGKPLPVIRPVQDRDFWKALLAPENRSELRWSGFQRALKGIGYHIVRQGGSARRFEFEDGAGGENPGTIVFHEPHGGKVSHREAQDWWLKRLKTRMTLNIEDQDEV